MCVHMYRKQPLLLSCSVHCASLAASSKLLCCGFADSSLHMWSLLPSNVDHVTGSGHVAQSRTDMGPPPVRLRPRGESCDHRVLLGHSGPVYGTCFGGGGQFLLSGSEDCCIRLWNVGKGSPLVCYRGHAYPVWDVAFRSVLVYHLVGWEWTGFL